MFQFISIHAPRVRCDIGPYELVSQIKNFNPRTSCEVRLLTNTDAPAVLVISIHAPRVRCDSSFAAFRHPALYFNPRTSCEVRPFIEEAGGVSDDFNPRTSCEVRR